MSTTMMAKLFVKNFHEKLTSEDIANAIRAVDVGSVHSVQVRTSRRNVHHAIVEIVWDDTKSTSQFLRGLLNAGNTVCISLNSNRPNSYLEMVEYQEDIDTKRRKHNMIRYKENVLLGYPRQFHRNIHGPPPHPHPHSRSPPPAPPAPAPPEFIDEYNDDELFASYGNDLLRSIGIY